MPASNKPKYRFVLTALLYSCTTVDSLVSTSQTGGAEFRAMSNGSMPWLRLSERKQLHRIVKYIVIVGRIAKDTGIATSSADSMFASGGRSV